ncbi:UPF0545 protein C22orf39 homolog [Elysia marginata]|uniref:UPF0545 protein C22orf39 homolog n=1 Tax=Elysia marginata TaxID=1093978 RepID=A0AAV4EXR8_9GAST|nr:UPF0545 protein C22orf39 homolog [Elysia marginata]
MASGDGIDFLPKDVWLMRPCEVYKEEYNDCKKLLSRFYQYYVDGTKRDCSQWLIDFNNCIAFRKTKDPKAMVCCIIIIINAMRLSMFN